MLDAVVKAVVNPTKLLDAYLTERAAESATFLRDMSQASFYTYTKARPAPSAAAAGGSASSAEQPTTSSAASASATETDIRVVNLDCLESARLLAASGSYRRVGVLSMANEYNCGGAFSVHWGSQEEYLFRNSTLGLSLWGHRRHDNDKKRSWTVGTQLIGDAPRRGSAEEWYPWPDCGGVLTPRVEVFSISDKPLPRAQWFEVTGLSIAAQDLRPRTYNPSQGQAFDPALLTAKLRTLFKMAVDANCDALVLGAIGCGAFRNPPEVVADKFFELLQGEYRNVFARIDFAVIKNEDNLLAFQRRFKSFDGRSCAP